MVNYMGNLKQDQIWANKKEQDGMDKIPNNFKCKKKNTQKYTQNQDNFKMNQAELK